VTEELWCLLVIVVLDEVSEKDGSARRFLNTMATWYTS